MEALKLSLNEYAYHFRLFVFKQLLDLAFGSRRLDLVNVLASSPFQELTLRAPQGLEDIEIDAEDELEHRMPAVDIKHLTQLANAAAGGDQKCPDGERFLRSGTFSLATSSAAEESLVTTVIREGED
ncbi:hypothetical protein LINGRAHAP2_LOCUS10872 [Linum grandiflorum]